MALVTLRPVVRADAAELVRANQASRELHHPWAEPLADEAGFDAWFGRILTGPLVGLIARDAATGEIAGVVNVIEIVYGKFYRGAVLGYYGVAGMGGRGLMTESVRLATRHAFDELGLHRLEANIQPGNARSIALVKRLGFRREGLSPRYLRMDGDWRDHERWALLADEVA
ncbi:MAG: GNAT family protein [Geminicoccaceae bacterium]